MELEQFLKETLLGTKKLAILGAGAILNADDGAGVIITDNLQKKFNEDNCKNLRIYTGNTAPENFSGEIKKFSPDHLIVIDAADLKEEPGSIMIIDPDIIDGVSFSTHMLPLKVMLQYIQKEIGCRITILGIQVADVVYGNPVTEKINQSINETITILQNQIFYLGLAL
jgi:hydrogenase 3 maturation protease